MVRLLDLSAERLRQRLQEQRGRGHGLGSDLAIAHRLGADDVTPPTAATPTRPAAVLVPLVRREDGDGLHWSLLLTRRTDHLHHHPGQISFPGGRLEDDDASPEACALREAEEETGLSPQRVEILGRLDPYITVTRFTVEPIVALVHPPFTLAPDPFEVAEVFEVPLPFLLDPANHRRVERTIDGKLRPYYAVPYQNYYIWGATAAMILNLSRVLWPLCANDEAGGPRE